MDQIGPRAYGPMTENLGDLEEKRSCLHSVRNALHLDQQFSNFSLYQNHDWALPLEVLIQWVWSGTGT